MKKSHTRERPPEDWLLVRSVITKQIILLGETTYPNTFEKVAKLFSFLLWALKIGRHIITFKGGVNYSHLGIKCATVWLF